MKPVMNVVLTGGAGQIAYSAVFRIAAGEMLGKDQPINIRLLDIEDKKQEAAGVKMELDDCAFPLLKEVSIHSDPMKAFEGVDLALLIGAKPRGPGMERSALLAENGKIFVEQGRALNQVAHKNVKVIVVGNPCNTNALIAMREATQLNPRNFFAMTRLDQNRAAYQMAAKAGVSITDISKMIVWGNHSSTQVPDYYNAKVKGKPAVDVIGDEAWFGSTFIPTVQARGAEVIKVRGKSSAASAANALIDSVRSFMVESDEWFSLGVLSDGNPYGVAEGLIYSFPCISRGNGEVSVVNTAKLNDDLRTRIKASEEELIQEREMAMGKLAAGKR
ncbi:malate dehydrogenase [Estrella lausannensis]|uniref:Malate dehydrogenase n=1 Tax=Estrella lausannensis TaxID=483423 RepID=A0A0H5DQH0_9BACT|nr:malate dehydrogenase [Estrella lausannensis]CRX38323.1 Malate dehydrogenase [Estrella lausannensis]